MFSRTLGRPLVSKIMIAVLRAVLELGHVRRGPGQSGELKRYVWTLNKRQSLTNVLHRFSANINGISTWRYLDQQQVFTQWAQSLVIQVCSFTPEAIGDTDVCFYSTMLNLRLECLGVVA